MPAGPWVLLQVGEFASALQRAGLGLTPGEVQQLAVSMRDGHNSVEYRPFVSKLWGKLQGSADSSSGSGDSASSGGGEAAAGGTGGGSAAPQHMPQFVAARQRRLQTNVALALGQQPEATAREAAELAAALPGVPLPWKVPAVKQFG